MSRRKPTDYRHAEPDVNDAMLDRARYVPVPAPSKIKPWAMRRPVGRLPRSGSLRPVDAPPLVTRGESGSVGAEPVVIRDGLPVYQTARNRGVGKVAFIDWINITLHEESFFWTGDGVPVTDDQVLIEVSIVCESIFGYGITAKREKGANFYRNSYDLGDSMGLVCYGGQRDTVLISISGEGCAGAQEGWEQRLFHFLKERGKRARITRVDLAHDDYTGARYSVDKAVSDYDDGLFNCGGRMPDIEQRGNWKRINGKGRTVYIGNRTNGKFLRVYEKGRQLGQPDSEWVRVEGELKGVDRDIPLDVLLTPGEYLAAMYPALGWLCTEQKRIKTTAKEADFSYKKMKEWLHRQCGAALWFLAEIEGSAEAALAEVVKEGQFPKAIKGLMDWKSVGIPIHKIARVPVAPGQFVQFA